MAPLPTLRALAVLAFVAAGCAPAPGALAPPGPTTAGHLLIVGGGSQPPALVERFVQLAGGPGSRIAVIPLASGVPERTGPAKVEDLVALGADAFVLQPDRAVAAAESAAELLDGATGVWFTGGDQARITRVLSGTRLAAAIAELYRSGGVIGGTSAGAAIMTDSMLTGEQILAGEDTIGYHGDEFRRIARGAIHMVPGLGFLPGAIVDQHFVERERHNRLLSVVLERPHLVGAGIAESTAIEVRPDGTWAVVGSGSVVIYDARSATLTDEADPLGVAGARMHILPAGSTFHPRSGEARLP